MDAIEKGHSKFQWFIFIILIPVLFTVILSLVLLNFSGFNVAGHIKQIGSDISGIATQTSDSKEEQLNNDKLLNDLEEMQMSADENGAIISQLETELLVKADEIQQLNGQVETLKIELTRVQQEKAEKQKDIAEITKMYEIMSPKNAASILALIDNEEAKVILTEVKTDKLAAILEKMDPDDAARLMTLITKK